MWSTVQAASCPLCGGKTIVLPVPNPEQSVISDGRMVARALKKLSCLACGAACHASNPSPDDIKAIYARDY
jgi:rRNA maturation protein Nop10